MNIEQVGRTEEPDTFKKTHHVISDTRPSNSGDRRTVGKSLGRQPVNRFAHLNGSFFAFNLLLDKNERENKNIWVTPFYTRTQCTNKDYSSLFHVAVA